MVAVVVVIVVIVVVWCRVVLCDVERGREGGRGPPKFFFFGICDDASERATSAALSDVVQLHNEFVCDFL